MRDEQSLLLPYTVVKHFKGNFYCVLGVATHSETGEEEVVYMPVNGTDLYVRPKTTFLSEVDKEKYPQVEQKFRFEYVSPLSQFVKRA